MLLHIKNWLNRNFPQNYVIRKPLTGALIISLVSLIFVLLYQPLGAHPGKFLGFELTMLAYVMAGGLLAFILVKGLKTIPFFSDEQEWTIFKELSAIILLLIGFGTAIYFAAFIIEEPADRWNFSTFFDSLKKASLIAIIPLGFFFLINVRYWFAAEQLWFASAPAEAEAKAEATEKEILITSQLKKEELWLFPSEFICAESEGNYVKFFLWKKGKVQKAVIRNSITNIEDQFAKIPYIVRTHRAFIVNLKKVTSRKGNALGYDLKLTGIENEIPVSRNKVKDFNRLFGQIS
ncbi:MAG: LytTR family DNA-binding domain-containing protein [Bacteroides sp.]|jgi:hypothetical protein|nr:LytTR family DNA-binding domain-containing protein [Bacteroides sp.]